MTRFIYVIRSILTDGSDVYAVRLDNGEPIDMVTEQDAFDFAAGLQALIEKHSNDSVERNAWGFW